MFYSVMNHEIVIVVKLHMKINQVHIFLVKGDVHQAEELDLLVVFLKSGILIVNVPLELGVEVALDDRVVVLLEG